MAPPDTTLSDFACEETKNHTDLVSTNEPLLTQSTERYVMFPIQDDTVWKMYKKQID